MHTKFSLGLGGLILFGLMGCTSLNIDHSVQQSNVAASDFTQGNLVLVRDQKQRDSITQFTKEILQKPLSQNDAVKISLMYSPAFQTILAQSWESAAGVAQSGRIANPNFSFERVVFASELELGRLLSVGLFEFLTLPARYRDAAQQLAVEQLRLTERVVELVTIIRQAWIRAVAAQQMLQYVQQVFDAAQVSAELARKMYAVGNFSKLQRARQQVFYAQAVTQLANAKHQVLVTRERLIRLLGLTDEDAEHLILPDKLPDLPKTPMQGEALAARLVKEQLNIQLARAQYDAARQKQGLSTASHFMDVEFGVRRDTVIDRHESTSTPKRGFELSVRLPIFDWGGLKRDAMQAQTLAAANQLEATLRASGSFLRESYSAYRTAFDVARHYQDEMVPMSKLIAEENVLRYNGMFIGVFDLLSDAREQVNTVLDALKAQENFWLSEAALQSSIIGKPVMSNIEAVNVTNSKQEASH